LGEGNLAAGRAVLDFISSDETLDRYGEIIAASGWRLENYRRNPVFQNAHQYGDVIFTLGRALITEVREGGGTKATGGTKGTSFLYQKIEFATDVNPMARIAYGLYKGKFLNAVSVGFIPLRWVNGDEKSECRMTNDEVGAMETVERESVTALERGSVGGFRRKYIEQELLEVSAVGIPANPNALALGLKAGVVEKSDLRELQELLRRRLFLVLLVLTIVVIALTTWGFSRIPSLGDNRPRPITDVEIAAIASQLLILVMFMFSFVLAFSTVFAASPAISAEVESGITLAMLARPITRLE